MAHFALLNGCAEGLEVKAHFVLLNGCAEGLEVKAHFVLLNGCAGRLEVKAHCTVRVVALLYLLLLQDQVWMFAGAAAALLCSSCWATNDFFAFLGGVAKFRKAAVSFAVSQHGPTRLQLGGLS